MCVCVGGGGWGGGRVGGCGVGVCVSACACTHAHLNRYRCKHTDREFYHSVCTDVYPRIGVDTTHAHAPSFLVPSAGTPWSCRVGSDGESLVECPEGSQDSFP